MGGLRPVYRAEARPRLSCAAKLQQLLTSMRQFTEPAIVIPVRTKGISQRPLRRSERRCSVALSSTKADKGASAAPLAQERAKIRRRRRLAERVGAGSKKPLRLPDAALPRAANDDAWERPQAKPKRAGAGRKKALCSSRKVN